MTINVAERREWVSKRVASTICANGTQQVLVGQLRQQFIEDWGMDIKKLCDELGVRDWTELLQSLPGITLNGHLVYKMLEPKDHDMRDIVEVINKSQVNNRPRPRDRVYSNLSRSNSSEYGNNHGLFQSSDPHGKPMQRRLGGSLSRPPLPMPPIPPELRNIQVRLPQGATQGHQCPMPSPPTQPMQSSPAVRPFGAPRFSRPQLCAQPSRSQPPPRPQTPPPLPRLEHPRIMAPTSSSSNQNASRSRMSTAAASQPSRPVSQPKPVISPTVPSTPVRTNKSAPLNRTRAVLAQHAGRNVAPPPPSIRSTAQQPSTSMTPANDSSLFEPIVNNPFDFSCREEVLGPRRQRQQQQSATRPADVTAEQSRLGASSLMQMLQHVNKTTEDRKPPTNAAATAPQPVVPSPRPVEPIAKPTSVQSTLLPSRLPSLQTLEEEAAVAAAVAVTSNADVTHPIKIEVADEVSTTPADPIDANANIVTPSAADDNNNASIINKQKPIDSYAPMPQLVSSSSKLQNMDDIDLAIEEFDQAHFSSDDEF